VKTAIALMICLLSATEGCRRDQTGPKNGNSATSSPLLISPKVPPPDDRSEILIRHLLRRVADLDAEINKLRTEMVKRDNQWLKEEIAILEGRPTPKRDPNEGMRQLKKDLIDGLDRQSQQSLDLEDAIELHNLRHPESPQADVNGILRMECGDCTKERARRALQLEEEAEKYTKTIK
jgi:hypothetical protein